MDKFATIGEDQPPAGYGWQGRSVGGRYWQTFRSLEEAKADSDGYVVLESHNGGVILMVIPAPQVWCDEAALVRLLHDMQVIDFHHTLNILFSGFDPVKPIDIDATFRDSDIRYERYQPGENVGGAPGHSAKASIILWVAPQFEALGLKDQIRAVLENRQYRLEWTHGTLTPRIPETDNLLESVGAMFKRLVLGSEVR